MSFHLYASTMAPASPAPSYQASSQSEWSSPGGNSTNSFSTGHASPSWAAPMSPNARNNGDSNRSFAIWAPAGGSTARNNASQTDSVNAFKTDVDNARERGSNIRALELLDITAGEDVQNILRLDSSEGSEGVQSLKSSVHSNRERLSGSRALMLLQETAGYDVDCTAIPVNTGPSQRSVEDKSISSAPSDVAQNDDDISEPVRQAYMSSAELRQHMTAQFKAKKMGLIEKDPLSPRTNSQGTSQDKKDFQEEIRATRERGANSRALALLDSTCGRDVSELAKATSIPHVKPVLTARETADHSHDIRRQLKAEYKAKKKMQQENPGLAIPTLVRKVEQEKLAESSRKPKDKTADDIRDPETVAGMKCNMDIERENDAKKKALQLLNERPGCMA